MWLFDLWKVEFLDWPAGFVDRVQVFYLEEPKK